MGQKKFDLVASRQFMTEEIDRLTDANGRAAAARSASASRRDVGRTPIVVACMDERNALTEEGLGLDPTLVRRFASGGGKIGPDDFLRICAPLLTDRGSRVTIFLTTHEVVGYPD